MSEAASSTAKTAAEKNLERIKRLRDLHSKRVSNNIF